MKQPVPVFPAAPLPDGAARLFHVTAGVKKRFSPGAEYLLASVLHVRVGV